MNKKILLAAVVLMVFTSCAAFFALLKGPERVIERKDEKAALLYGCFNLQNNRSALNMNWMSMLQYEPPTEKPYWGAAIRDGVFFNQNLLPGEYCIDTFGSDDKKFQLSAEMGCFEIEKSDLFYYGSYELVWSNGKPRTLKRAFKPSEADVIEKILETTDKGTYWEGKLKKRLAILREAEARKANIPRAPMP